MKAKRQFSAETVAILRESKGLRIQAGTSQHRFTGIWVVVVKDRVFVRSWSVKPNGWYRTLLTEPGGTIQVLDLKIEVRAILTKSERVRDAIDRAYLEKYKNPGALKYAKGPRPCKIQSNRGSTRAVIIDSLERAPLLFTLSPAVPILSGWPIRTKAAGAAAAGMQLMRWSP
jgi:hypothetical protein